MIAALVARCAAARGAKRADVDAEAVIADWCEENDFPEHAAALRRGGAPTERLAALVHLVRWVSEPPALDLELFGVARNFFRNLGPAGARWAAVASDLGYVSGYGKASTFIARRFVIDDRLELSKVERMIPGELLDLGSVRRLTRKKLLAPMAEAPTHPCPGCRAPALFITSEGTSLDAAGNPRAQTNLIALCLRRPHVTPVATSTSTSTEPIPGM